MLTQQWEWEVNLRPLWSHNETGAIYEQIPGVHRDTRRDLLPMFNGDFQAQQIKIATLHEDSVLWGHSHPDYRELFTVITGKALFRLLTATGEVELFPLEPGTRLIIPPQVAHDAFVTKWTILVWATEKQYISPEVNDVPQKMPDFVDTLKKLLSM